MKTIELLDLKQEYKLISREVLPRIKKVMSEGRFILGEELIEFEKQFASYCGAKYAVGVASGTSALFLALKVCGVGRGDEVITTSMSFNATAQAIVYTGATPVFTDVDPETLTIDVNDIVKKITSRTKVILPVHLYGIPAPMREIMKIAKTYGLMVVEDCAQAHGSLYHGKKMGTLGDLGAYSFMPAKNLGAYGDAGAIVTNNKQYADQLKKLRNHGRTSKYVHDELGYAERMDNLQATVLLVKLPYLDVWNKRRQEIAHKYDVYLLPKVNTIKAPPGTISNYYTYILRVSNRSRFMRRLSKSGIQTGIYYPFPLHLQPVFRNLGYTKGSLPVVEKYSGEIVAIPVHQYLSDEDVNYIINTINTNA
jgi:dTDP-4-amino-4,6-dideoxygalactose transaminase